jgi:phosphate:Na+ symporter
MHEIARDMVNEANTAFLENDDELAKAVMDKEEIVNEIEEELITFMTRIPQGSLTEEDNRTLDAYFAVVDSIESVADDAYDLAELTKYKIKNKIEFSAEALSTLTDIREYIAELTEKSIEIVATEDMDLLPDILDGEKKLDNLQLQNRKSHMKRLNVGTCLPSAGIIFLEALEDLEHISDQFADIGLTLEER